jgi:hypothetical protein
MSASNVPRFIVAYMVSTRKPRNVLPEKKSVANKLAYAVLLMVATVLIYQKLIIGPTIVFKSL